MNLWILAECISCGGVQLKHLHILNNHLVARVVFAFNLYALDFVCLASLFLTLVHSLFEELVLFANTHAEPLAAELFSQGEQYEEELDRNGIGIERCLPLILIRDNGQDAKDNDNDWYPDKGDPF